VAYPDVFDKLEQTQSAYEKLRAQEHSLTKELEKTRSTLSETSEAFYVCECNVSALKEELTRFFKLPSPVGVGMELEVDMRGTVRIGGLQPRMSAHACGALFEGDVVLSIDNVKVSGSDAAAENIEAYRALLVGKRASIVAIEVQRAKNIFTVNLKRGSWGPEHASLSSEKPTVTPMIPKKTGQLPSVTPKPSGLEMPSNVVPGGGGGKAIQGNYAAARRGQAQGMHSSTHDSSERDWE
jgi:hypothetical protein